MWPAQVEKMAKQLGTAGAGAYTCETAAHFWLLHVLARWEKFSAAVAQLKTADCVKVTPCHPLPSPALPFSALPYHLALSLVAHCWAWTNRHGDAIPVPSADDVSIEEQFMNVIVFVFAYKSVS